MHRPHPRLRPLAALILAPLAVLTVPAPAAHAESYAETHTDSRPAVTLAAPDVTGSSATLAFSVNRAVNAIGATACTLTDSTDVVTQVDCGTGIPGAARRTTDYTTTLTRMAAGDYVYAVTVTLTDGGTATGTRPVTVSAVEPVPFAASRGACESLPGGAFVADVFWWQVWTCDFDATSDDVVTGATAALEPQCLGTDGGVGFAGGLVAPGRYELTCWAI